MPGRDFPRPASSSGDAMTLHTSIPALLLAAFALSVSAMIGCTGETSAAAPLVTCESASTVPAASAWSFELLTEASSTADATACARFGTGEEVCGAMSCDDTTPVCEITADGTSFTYDATMKRLFVGGSVDVACPLQGG
jgi:hypothetical protein